jgi:hypothetical protein
MRAKRDDRTLAELMAHDEVGRADHTVGLNRRLRRRMPFHGIPKPLQQLRRPFGMTLAVAGRVIRRDSDQVGEKLRLRLMLGLEKSSDRPCDFFVRKG